MRRSRLILIGLTVMVAGIVVNGLDARVPRHEAVATAQREKAEDRQTQVTPDYSGLKRDLAEYLDGQQGEFAVFVKDLASGASFDINGDRPMHPASTIKLPVVLYVHREVAEGRARWDDRVIYRHSHHFREGSGNLQATIKDGSSRDLRTLTKLAITVSDNIAYQMLLSHVDRKSLHNFMRELGGQTVFPAGRNLSTTGDMGAYLEGVLDFAARYPEAGAVLLHEMEHSIYNDGIPKGLPARVRVAHKQGMLPNAANDAAIVFGERPFLLVMFSDRLGVNKGFSIMAEVTRRVYAFQNNLQPVNVRINGEDLYFSDVGAYISENNRTLVPFRVVLEKLGATVTWDSQRKTAIAVLGRNRIEQKVGEQAIIVNGQRRETDDYARIVPPGRIVIPVRAVAEALLGAKVTWLEEERTVDIVLD